MLSTSMIRIILSINYFFRPFRKAFGPAPGRRFSLSGCGICAVMMGENGARAGVGVIVPPAAVRKVVDTTAAAVSKKPALEGVLKERKANDPKFSFLFEQDPYYQYYRSKVVGTQASNEKENNAEAEPKKPAKVENEPPKAAPDLATTTAAPVVSKLRLLRTRKDAARKTPQEQPSEDVFTIDFKTEAPSSLVLDIMKLTAQFIAQNGTEFQNQLQEKEARNPTFDFLNPTHPLFSTFQRLIDAYSAILRPPGGKDEVIAKLRKNAESRDPLLERVWSMHDWEQQRNERAQAAAENAEERWQAAQIDWQDFTPLETIDLDDEDEALPAPIADAQQLPRVLAAAEKARLEQEKNRKDVDMDIDDGDNVVVGDIHADVPADRVVKSAIGPANAGQPQKEAYVKLPSGQMVPASQAEKAVQAELFDPAFKEERARALERSKQQNLASDAEMVRSLARLNKSRNEAGVYNRGDLQSGLAARPRVSAEEVDATLARAAASGPQLPKRLAGAMGGGSRLETAEKRARLEAARDALTKKRRLPEADAEEEELLMPAAEPVATPAGLVAEAEWLERNGEAVQIVIKVPKHGNANWDLQGQEMEIKAPLKSTIGKLKKKLSGALKVPANKQKLQCATGGFMKDKMTLAFYNIADKSVIQMEVKERGGRKKKD